jgi:putative FmdB family regulatory protein
MPLYEYECDACGRRFERIQKFSDPPVAACPTCDGPVRKLLSTPAIQFKGSGFYITDYARAGKSGSDGDSKADKKPDAAAGGSADKAPEKPAEKPAASGGSESPAASSSGAKSEPTKPAVSSSGKDKG